ITNQLPITYRVTVSGSGGTKTYGPINLGNTHHGLQMVMGFGPEMTPGNPPSTFENVRIPAGETMVFYPRPVNPSPESAPYAGTDSTYQRSSAPTFIYAWPHNGGSTLTLNGNYGEVVRSLA